MIQSEPQTLLSFAPRIFLVVALLGLMGLAAYWLRHRQQNTFRRLALQDRVSLTRGTSLVIVQVEERRLLLSVSADGARLIQRLGPNDDSDTPAPTLPGAARFGDLIDRFRTGSDKGDS